MEFVVQPANGGWEWKLLAAMGPLAASPRTYGSEAEARGAIAQFKRSIPGARYAKTTTIGGSE